MKIYINGIQVATEILPLESQTLDETLDALSFGFVNENEKPYAPMQKVKLEYDDSTEEWFVLATDNVEPFTLNGNKWRHNVTCVESTRELSKHVVRNSVFSQPASLWKIGHNHLSATTTRRDYEYIDGNQMWYYEYGTTQYEGYQSEYGYAVPIVFGEHEKVSRAFLTIEAQFAVAEPTSAPFDYADVNSTCKALEDVQALISAPSTITTLYALKVVYNDGGINRYEFLFPSDFGGGEILLNTEMECEKLVTILNQHQNVRVEPVHPFLFEGKMYYAATKHIPFFSLDFKIKAEVYYNTAYDVLNLLCERQKLSHFVNGNTVEKPALFQLPQSGDLYDLLKNTIAPNFIFTQATMYECVAEVFRLFDAIFTMDGDGTLGITYFNDENGDEVTPTMIGKVSSIAEERRANGLISYYQDARLEKCFPSEDGFAHTRSEDIGIPKEGDHNIVVDFPIDSVIEGYMRVAFSIKYRCFDQGAGEFDNSITVLNYVMDVSRYIVEESIWSGYLSSTDQIPHANPENVVQNSSVYYQKGSTSVKLGYTYTSSWQIQYYAFGNMMNAALWFNLGWINVNDDDTKVTYPASSTPDWEAVTMRIRYYTSVDGRLKVESITDKCRGDIIVDQSNGAVDLNKLGLNILGLSMKLGEPTLNANVKPFKWADRIKTGDRYVYQNETWVANVCSYTALGNGYYKGSISFVKDYNELSLRRSVLREKRFSNVSRTLTQKSEDNLIEYCYYSTSLPSLPTVVQSTVFTKAKFQACVGISFGAEYPEIETLDYCYLERDDDEVYIPTLRYGAGNMVCFEMSFDDPMSAGIRTKATFGWFQTSYISDYVLYTDEEGFADEFTIRLAQDANGSMSEDFPIVDADDYAFSIARFKAYKQPNEVFALNYSIAFLPCDKDLDFVGSGFIDDNFLIAGRKRNRNLYLAHSANKRYSVLTRKAIGQMEAITSVGVTTGDYATISVTHEEISDCVSWAICDENREILFASNRQNGDSTHKIIYFKLIRDRIE